MDPPVESASMPSMPVYAAGACAFSPQHYRPRVCRLCFLSEAQHQPDETNTQNTDTASETKQEPHKIGKLKQVAKRDREQVAAEQSVDLLPSSMSATSSGSVSVSGSTSSRSNSSPESSTFSKSGFRSADASASSCSDRDSAEEGWVSEEDESVRPADQSQQQRQVEIEVAASAMPASSAPAEPSSTNSRSVSISFSSGARSDLLRALTGEHRLRRRSEYAPLKAKPIVMDLNSELTFAMRRKGLNQSKEIAARVSSELDDTQKETMQLLKQRLHAIGSEAAHPTSVDQLTELLEEHAAFLKTIAKVSSNMRSSASSSSSSSSTPALDDLDSSWPSEKLQVCLRMKDAIDKLQQASTAARRYTSEFEAHRRLGGGVETHASKHADWAFVDSAILATAMNALIDASRHLNTVASHSGGFLFVRLDSAFGAASAAASLMIDLLFAKCRIAYETSFEKTIGMTHQHNQTQSPANPDPSTTTETALSSDPVVPPSISSGSSSSPSSASPPRLTAVYSHTSKAIRSFQTLTIALQLFDQLNQPENAVGNNGTRLVEFSLEQRERRKELLALKSAIENSPEYKESINVALRKGEWDRKEEVKLRSTSMDRSRVSHGGVGVLADRFTTPRRVSAIGAAASSIAVGGSSTLTASSESMRQLESNHPNSYLLLTRSLRADGSASASVTAGLTPDADTAELHSLLAPIFEILDTPPLVAFICRQIVPAHHIGALDVCISSALLPRLESFSSAPDLRDDLLPLWFACASKGFTAGIELCVTKLQIDVNVRSNTQGNAGNTALHLAASGAHIDTMVALIRHGANPLTLNAFERNTLFSLRTLFARNQVDPASAAAAASDAPSAASAMQFGFMARYFNSPRLADVRLRVVDENGATNDIFAHRIVLCGQSEVFRVMVEDAGASRGVTRTNLNQQSGVGATADGRASLWASSIDEDDADDAAGPPLMPVDAVDNFESFSLFIRYFYTGSIVFTSDDLHVAAGVLQLSTRFMVDPLMELTSRHLARRIQTANAVSIYNLATLTAADTLQRRVEEFIITRYEQHHQEWNRTNTRDEENDHPHAFLIRVLSGLDVHELRKMRDQKKPQWRV